MTLNNNNNNIQVIILLHCGERVGVCMRGRERESGSKQLGYACSYLVWCVVLLQLVAINLWYTDSVKVHC